MLTIATAAGALIRARDLDGLAGLARVIGFSGESAALDREGAGALGLPDVPGAAMRVMAGAGVRRALLVACDADGPSRELVARIASRIGAASPHARWLVLASGAERGEIVVAACDPSRPGGRVAALVANRARIVDSDAETIRALAAAADADDVLTHLRWLDVLGREGISRRFYRTLERIVGVMADDAATTIGSASDEERATLALLQISRLLFLSFLEAKGWLDGDPAFLAHRFDACARSGGGFHRRVMLPLFFGTLNTPVARRSPAAHALGRIPFLNGGLFARSPLESRYRALRLGDETLGRAFFELLSRYRFTAREDSSGWSEAAVDPEMLGHAFESLMAGGLRRDSGAFFTPQPLVERLTTLALREALAGAAADEHVERLLRDEAPEDAEARASLRGRLTRLRLLDPACGSGAFLVHALERVARWLRLLGDARAPDALRRAVLTTSIFGVDVNPTAVWLCELRLWLSTVIESETPDPLAVCALPNLDRHIRVGDALAGGAFEESVNGARGGRALERMRARYSRAVGVRKRTLGRELEREERAQAIAALDRELARAIDRRREALAAARARDLFGQREGADAAGRATLQAMALRVRELRARRRHIALGGALPFAFGTQFADIGVRGGFDIVLGNPPWVRLHRIPTAMRAVLRREFRVYRDAAWADGIEDGRTGRGFASQVDLAALFIERGMTLLRDAGVLGFLVPAKLWRSLAGGGVRRLLLEQHTPLTIEDLSGAPHAFDAAVYPSLLVARARRGAPDTALHGAVSDARALDLSAWRDGRGTHWRTARAHLALDASSGAPWLLLPLDVRRAFEQVRASGIRLGATPLAPVLLGTKCGANDAFVVSVLAEAGTCARVRGSAPTRENGDRPTREGTVERDALRPLVRGEDVRAWRLRTSTERLVWTVDDSGAPLERLPAGVARWLAPWRRRLAERADAAGRARWWALYRTRGAAHDLPRVVWPDVARAPRAAVLPAGDDTVPLNSCYLARCPRLDDALALAAILNSPLAAAWLRVLAEPARGGYVRLMAWCVALLPLPLDWEAAVRILAPVARAAIDGAPPDADALLQLTLRAYRLRRTSIAPLLEWDA